MKYKSLLLSLIATTALVACGGDDDDNGGIHFGPVEFGEYESRIEVPEMLKSGTKFISHSTKENGHDVMSYCMEYDLGRLHSRWVAFRFDGDTRALGSGRTDAWADDPEIDSKYQIGSGYFAGYNRGHICASYDRQYSQKANAQTFYMTNMTPMYGQFNSEYWSIFENFIQTKGRNASFADTLYVVKGGTIYDTNKVLGTCRTSSGKNTIVPKYYFIAALKRHGDTFSGIGFWVEHTAKPSTNGMSNTGVLRKCSMNIDDLELKTGINFFHNLRDDKENPMESEDIETIRSAWGL